MRRLDEQGESALIQPESPANRFPDLVRQLVKQLKVLLPSMGKVRIAQTLAAAGLRLGPTTVGRISENEIPAPLRAMAWFRITGTSSAPSAPGTSGTST